MGMLSNIVGRYHVGTPTEEVVAGVMRKVQKGVSQERREEIAQEVREIHEANIVLYHSVMRGI